MRFSSIWTVAVAVGSWWLSGASAQQQPDPAPEGRAYTAAELDEIESSYKREELKLARQLLGLKLQDRLDPAQGAEKYQLGLGQWWTANNDRLVAQVERRRVLDRHRPHYRTRRGASFGRHQGASREVREREEIRRQKFLELVPHGPDVDHSQRDAGLARFAAWMDSPEGSELARRLKVAREHSKQERSQAYLDATGSVALDPVADETPQDETARLKLKLRREAARRQLQRGAGGTADLGEVEAMREDYHLEVERLEVIGREAAIQRLRNRIQQLSEQIQKLEPRPTTD